MAQLVDSTGAMIMDSGARMKFERLQCEEAFQTIRDRRGEPFEQGAQGWETHRE